MFSKVELLISVSEEVVVASELDRGGVWCVGLNDDFTLELTAASSPGNLSQQLKGALAGAEIGNMQAEVCVEYANERDIGEVKPFSDHLGADDDVEFALAKFL